MSFGQKGKDVPAENPNKITINKKDEIVDYNRYLLDQQNIIIKERENKVLLQKDLSHINDRLKSYEKLLDSIQLSIRTDEVTLKQKKGQLLVLDQDVNNLRNRAMKLSYDLEIRQFHYDSLKNIVNMMQSSIDRNQQQITIKNERISELGLEISKLTNGITTKRNKTIDVGQEIQKHKETLLKNKTTLALLEDKIKNEQEGVKRVEEKLNVAYKTKEENILETKSLEEKIAQSIAKKTTNSGSIVSWKKELDGIKLQIDTKTKKQNDSKLTADEYKVISADLETLRGQESKRQQELHLLEQENITLETEIIKSKEKVANKNTEKKEIETKISGLLTEKNNQVQLIDLILMDQRSSLETKNKSELEINYLQESIQKENTEIAALDLELRKFVDTKNSLSKEVEALQKENQTTKEEIVSDKAKSDAEFEKMNDIRKQIERVNTELKIKEKMFYDQRSEMNSFIGDMDEKKLEFEGVDKNVKRVRSKSDSISSGIKTVDPRVDSLMLTGIEFALEALDDTSIYFFNEALKIDNKVSGARFLKCYTMFIHDKDEDALKELNQLISIDSKYLKAFILRAKIYTYKGQYLYAVKDYDHIIYLDKTNPTAYIDRGKMYYFNMNTYEKGCADWQKALDLGAPQANVLIAEHCNLDNKNAFEIKHLSKVSTEPSYGFETTNPIKVGKDNKGSDGNVAKYFNLLRSPNGKEITFHKVGSCCPYPSQNGVNGKALVYKYQIEYYTSSTKKKTIFLYITHYDYDTPKVPMGFKTEHEIY